MSPSIPELQRRRWVVGVGGGLLRLRARRACEPARNRNPTRAKRQAEAHRGVSEPRSGSASTAASRGTPRRERAAQRQRSEVGRRPTTGSARFQAPRQSFGAALGHRPFSRHRHPFSMLVYGKAMFPGARPEGLRSSLLDKRARSRVDQLGVSRVRKNYVPGEARPPNFRVRLPAKRLDMGPGLLPLRPRAPAPYRSASGSVGTGSSRPQGACDAAVGCHLSPQGRRSGNISNGAVARSPSRQISHGAIAP